MSVEIISGPSVTGPQGLSKEAAEQALLQNPTFPKGADYTIMAHQGQWIAAVSTPDLQKVAEFPPSGGGDDGGSDGGSDGPPSDDGGSDDGSSDGGSPDGGGSDGPPHHDKDDKGGDKGGMHGLEAKIDLLLSALGIDPSGMGGDPMGAGDPMGGGMGGPPPGPPGPPHAGHPGAGGPPPGAGGPPPRPMKPGETPPGGTPLGAPAFASVKEQHPWGHTIGKVAAFTVRESLGTEPVAQVHDELQSLAKAGGFRVARFTPFHDENGARHVEAVIQTPKQ